jgi:hypothetical protein
MNVEIQLRLVATEQYTLGAKIAGGRTRGRQGGVGCHPQKISETWSVTLCATAYSFSERVSPLQFCTVLAISKNEKALPLSGGKGCGADEL